MCAVSKMKLLLFYVRFERSSCVECERKSILRPVQGCNERSGEAVE